MKAGSHRTTQGSVRLYKVGSCCPRKAGVNRFGPVWDQGAYA